MSERHFSLAHATLPARTGGGLHPGLLLLHGRGTDEYDLLPLAGELDARLFTVSARGPLQFPYGGFAWYDLDPRGVGYPGAGSLGQTIDLLDRFIDEILEAYPIAGGRLFAGGFSMGAAMSASLALLFPDRIAGALILSGYVPVESGLPFRAEAAAGHRIFEAHGTRDVVIPVEWGRRSQEYLASTPVALTYQEYPMAHEISQAELRDASTWLTAALDASETAAGRPEIQSAG